MDYRDVLVHYLTRGGEYGDQDEAMDAVKALEDAVKAAVVDGLIEDGRLVGKP